MSKTRRVKVKGEDGKSPGWPHIGNIVIYACPDDHVHIRFTSTLDARLGELVMTPEDALDYAQQLIKVCDKAMDVH